jgi:hypothetical protein
MIKNNKKQKQHLMECAAWTGEVQSVMQEL